MVTNSVPVSEICDLDHQSGKKENKDSTENKKTVKGSEAIWNLFIRG